MSFLENRKIYYQTSFCLEQTANMKISENYQNITKHSERIQV